MLKNDKESWTVWTKSRGKRRKKEKLGKYIIIHGENHKTVDQEQINNINKKGEKKARNMDMSLKKDVERANKRKGKKKIKV